MREKWKREILKILKDGPKTTKQIAEKLGKSPSYVRRLLSELRKEGLVESVDLGVTKEHRLTRRAKLLFEDYDDGVLKARVHNTRVPCYVLRADFDKIAKVGREIKMRNWKAYIVNLHDLLKACDVPIPPNVPNIKIQFNKAKKTTAILYLPQFYASSKWEAAREIHNMFQKIRRALLIAGIELDEDWERGVFAEYGFEVDAPLDPGHEIRLGRNAKDPFGNELPTEARVWVDESRGREIDNNDGGGYTHKYLMMPEYIAEMYRDFKRLNGFLDKFERVLEKQSELMEKQTENLSKSTELQYAFAENLSSHIPYVQNAATALEKITQVVELQQRQQTQFLEAMQQVVSQLAAKEPRWTVFLPFLLLLVLLVKGVIV